MPGQPAWSHSDPVAVAALARPSSPFGAMITITTASTGHCADLGRLLCDQEPEWPPTSEGERCLLNELAACPVIAGIGPKTPGPLLLLSCSALQARGSPPARVSTPCMGNGKPASRNLGSVGWPSSRISLSRF
jgi:hypothetical protein